MAYEVQLDTFQGPLELLYQLIKKNKIEISEISLAEITDQYLKYINHLQGFNLEMASNFMVIAAELIELKAQAILPQDDNENKEKDINDNTLVQRLQEYQLFKEISLVLHEYAERASDMFKRPVQETNWVDEDIQFDFDVDLSDLVAAFQKAMQSANNQEEEVKKDNTKGEWPDLSQGNIKIQDKIQEIMDMLTIRPNGLTFYNIIKDKKNRLEIVVTFLSILELIKLRRVKVNQDKLFSDIKIVAETG